MRIFFVFMVVCFHFHANWDSYPEVYIFLRELAVPVFLVIAFFLGEHTIEGDDTNKKKARMQRLFIPYIFWGVIMYAATLFVEHLLNKTDGAKVNELPWQLLTGCVESIDPPLFYLWEVMLFTLLGFVLFGMFKKPIPCIILAVLSVVCLWIQYDGRLTLFMKGFRYEIMYTFGRIPELLPFAALGMVISATGFYSLLRRYRVPSCVLLTVLVPLLLIFRDRIFVRPEQTLAYAGIALFVTAPLMFLWMALLPFEKLPVAVRVFIDTISEYTMGVFAIHWPLGKLLNMIYREMTGMEKTLWLCVIIFLISWIIAFAISRIPGRFSKMLVS